MNAATVAQIIQLILAPVVMVTSCGLIINGLLQRYAAINDRMRGMAHERLDLLGALGGEVHDIGGTLAIAPGHDDPLVRERLTEIDDQLPRLLQRHRMLHNALLASYGAVVTFVVSMFVIAAATLFHQSWLAVVALLMFLLGTAVLLLGVLLTTQEVRRSQDQIDYEVRRILGLTLGGVPDDRGH